MSEGAEVSMRRDSGLLGRRTSIGGMRRRNSLTRDQHFEHKAIFQIYDEDSDGKLSSEDTVRAMRAAGNMLTESDAQEIVVELDIDHEGQSDYEGYLRLLQKYQKPPVRRAEIKEAFRFLDDDGNGQLTSVELRHVLKTLGEPLNEDELADFMKHADANGDGSIDYHEFADLMIKPTRRRMSLFGDPRKK